MKKVVTLLGLSLLAATPVKALASDLDWQYVEGGYTQLGVDDNDEFDPDGIVVAGTYLTTPNIYVTGEYKMTEEGRFDLDMLTLGGGYRVALNNHTDAYAGANFERIDSSGYDENGYSVNAGLRTKLTPQLELLGEVGYYDVVDGEATVKVGANYSLTANWAVGASYESIGDLDAVALTARYSF
ncbi:outer membrane beta-barrel protein [Alteromonas halophila]|uniref:Outer membrane protein beta-barrel domain-containing protein n=1 Tax=Alteromonas halophila TaxID=516698 RepID=A0A918N0T7_9ALTE|nr:outer membrane beta-barrel protein [Alteromonas halophila]GGW90838.1 hypothetical protein GCM10007391_26420 [Alteromonas halophila]